MTDAPILYLQHPSRVAAWSAVLRELAPALDVRVWPEPLPSGRPVYALVWRPPPGLFASIPGLKGVFALGAGVDDLMTRTDLPADIPLVRLTDAGMARQMVEYVLFGVLRFQRDFDAYARDQASALWRPQPPRASADVRVLVLGLGELGAQVAQTLAEFGYAVTGWSRSPKMIEGVDCIHGLDALDAQLPATDVLAAILPSTPQTRGLLDGERLERLAAGAGVINVGRGDLIDIEALCRLLDNGHLRGALLDVLPAEPPAPDSPLWGRTDILLTPHVAATTLPYPAARQILGKLEDLRNGKAIRGVMAR
ncbi:MAG: glyoxylate/hydroxypyruvate reductase A [Caulobacteraceae bacterium]